MQIEKSELVEVIKTVVSETIQQLGIATQSANQSANHKVASERPEKSAYAKTETLLYNYRNFQKIVQEKMVEVEQIERYGVPKRMDAVHKYAGGGSVSGIVLPEESVQDAVQNVLNSVQGTVQALSMVDKAMNALRNDPYYSVLEMRYFEGRTQEDIAYEFGRDTATISRNRTRLVKELAMRLFPDQVAQEYMQ